MTTTGNIHATALAAGHLGVLLLGPSGIGKSDLALRCLSLGAANGILKDHFRLIADDRVIITRRDQSADLALSAPDTIHGLIEVRGVGIVKLPDELVVRSDEAITLAVIITLTSEQPERLPDERQRPAIIQGHTVPSLALRPFEASAAQKVAIALMRHAVSRGFNS